MTGWTHLFVGTAAGVVVAAATGHPEWPKEVIIGVAAAAATVPDLDAEKSLIYQFVLPKVDSKMRRLAIGAAGLGSIYLTHYSYAFLLTGLFLLLTAIFPHRTFTHSLLALGMITWTVYLIDPGLAPAAFAGYASHLIADSMTPHGVPWLWPYQRYFRIARVPTGSGMDHVIGLTALFGAFFVWLIL